MRYFLALAILAIGCGGVSGEGAIDQNGCPADPPSGVTGTATLIGSNCSSPSQTANVTDGSMGGMTPKSATLLGVQDGICHFEVIFETSSCSMDYDVSVAAR